MPPSCAQPAARAVIHPIFDNAYRNNVEYCNTIDQGGVAAGSDSNGAGDIPGSYYSENDLVAQSMLHDPWVCAIAHEMKPLGRNGQYNDPTFISKRPTPNPLFGELVMTGLRVHEVRHRFP